MYDQIILVLLTLPSVLSIASCFIKDSNKTRRIIFNALLILNAIIYISPLAFTFLTTLAGENMWSENGPGAVLWAYMILIPACIFTLVVLFILKVVFRKKKVN